MEKKVIREIENIADYLGCNKTELVSEVSKLLDQLLQEERKSLLEYINKLLGTNLKYEDGKVIVRIRDLSK